MKIFSHLIDYFPEDAAPQYDAKKWFNSPRAWANHTILGMYLPDAVKDYEALLSKFGYTGIYDIRYRILTDSQLKEVQKLVNFWYKKTVVRFEEWLAEPGLHIFITVPRQKEKFEAFLKKYNLEDKVVFTSKPLWNLNYNDDTHTLQMFIVEQK